VTVTPEEGTCMTTSGDDVIERLEVYAMGALRVELSDGKKVGSTRRAPVLARVDRATGRVELYVDERGLETLEVVADDEGRGGRGTRATILSSDRQTDDIPPVTRLSIGLSMGQPVTGARCLHVETCAARTQRATRWPTSAVSTPRDSTVAPRRVLVNP